MKTDCLGVWPSALARCGHWMMIVLISGFACSAELTNHVTTSADSGSGSFRQAILDANHSGGGTICFSNVTETIPLLTSLPALAGRISIIGPGTNLIAISAPFGPLLIETQSVVRFSNFAFPPDALTISNRGSVVFSKCVMPSDLTIWNQGRLTIFSSLQHTNRGPLTVLGAGTTIIYDQHYQGIDLADGELQLFGCSSANRTRRGSSGGQRCQQNPFDPFVIWCETYSAGPAHGGGVLVSAGTLTMTGCSITNNQALGGDGVWAGSGYGAGVCLLSGKLRMTNCTVSGNIARGGLGRLGYRTSCSDGDAVGSGIYIGGGDASVVNCTISGNRAESAANPTTSVSCFPTHSIGAGIALYRGILRLVQCTVADNVAVPGAGGWVPDYFGGGFVTAGIGVGGVSSNPLNGFDRTDGRILIQNSIIVRNSGAGNLAQGFGYVVARSDAMGWIESMGNNLFGTTNPIGNNWYFIPVPEFSYLTGLTNSDLVRSDHGLGPLQDNGGPTWTHALLPGSPAIDAAVNPGLDRDQRGRPRTCDSSDVPNSQSAGGTDIGAFELEQSMCFTEVQRVGNHVQLTFPSVLGRSYFIEHSSNPSGGSWQRLPGNIVGTGGMVSYRHTNAALTGNHFYRTEELGRP